MCGVLGLVTSRSRELAVDDATIVRMRDRLKRRGPDDAGWWRSGHVALAHRRLAVIDPVHGAQPFHLGQPNAQGHRVLIYNGELYNARVLRRALIKHGEQFHTDCDTEVIARSLQHWGRDAFAMFRGMYALAWYDADAERLWLARDPLGIKPLVFAQIDTPNGRELAFASEPIALFDHPYITIRPDWATVSAYMTSIRTTLDDRTMYDGIRLIRPGHVIEVDLNGPQIELNDRRITLDDDHCTADDTCTFDQAASATRQVVHASVEAHLVSDVGLCALLSGGLDSTIITNIAHQRLGELRTYCAGAKTDAPGHDDFRYAREVAEHLGTTHTDVVIDQDRFDDLWPWMIGELGVPLSTPNEVAIYAVAQALAVHSKVTLSGEGADELFGGYGLALQHFAKTLMQGRDAVGRPITPARAYLDMTAWIRPESKSAILREDVCAAAEHDQHLMTSIEAAFADATDLPSALTACLHAQQSFNLAGLLGRLDTSTMLASVEGRTPFADSQVAAFARRQPFRHHVTLDGFDGTTGDSAIASVIGRVRDGLNDPVPPSSTKRLLRSAFFDIEPGSVLRRQKASFPLPFQSWLAGDASPLWHSALIRDIFHEEAIRAVHSDPVGSWQMAWPMLNIAIWLESIWGGQSLRIAA
jgi:asparagine synthase (glutamine-hydrolysing)